MSKPHWLSMTDAQYERICAYWDRRNKANAERRLRMALNKGRDRQEAVKYAGQQANGA